MSASEPSTPASPAAGRQRAGYRAAVALAAALALTTTVVPPASAAPSSDRRAQRLEIVVDTPDADTRDSIERRIGKGVAQAIGLFEQYRKEPLDQDARLRVRITPFSGDEIGYGVAIEGLLIGQVVDDSPEPFECTACTETELVDRVVEAVGQLLPKLQPEQEDPPQAGAGSVGPKPATTPEPETEPEQAQPAQAPRPKRLGKLGFAGVGLLAGGAVAVGVGLGLGLRKDRLAGGQPMEGDVEVISTKSAGWAILGIGAALVVTGTVLVIVDVKRRKTSASIAPMQLRAGGGVALSKRF